MELDSEAGGWKRSAEAWIAVQGTTGDYARVAILDPAMEAILGDVAGLQVLDVGCGEGRYARILARRGANVVGLDPVEAFIERARREHPEGTYLVGSAERMPLEDRAFDLTLSYLTLTDIPDYRSAIREMARVTAKGGRIIVCTLANFTSTATGWVRDGDGRKLHRAVDRYMEELSFDLDWSGIQIRNYHRPLSSVLNVFFQEGLVLDGFAEPLPATDSRDYAEEYRAPSFQIMTFRFPERAFGRQAGFRVANDPEDIHGPTPGV